VQSIIVAGVVFCKYAGLVERRRENDEPIGRPRKVDDDTMEQIREWREQGLSYSAIATLVEDIIGEPIDQSTIYRYCNDD